MIPTLQACAETEHDARLAHYRGTQALLNVMGINTDEHIAEDQQSTEQIITVGAMVVLTSASNILPQLLSR